MDGNGRKRCLDKPGYTRDPEVVGKKGDRTPAGGVIEKDLKINGNSF